MTTLGRKSIAWSAALIVSMSAMPAVAASGLTPETEDLSVLLLMAGLYVVVYVSAIGSVAGLVYLLCKATGSICNLLSDVLPVAAAKRIPNSAS